MIIPLCWVPSGGDQENVTSLSPALAVNFSGVPGKPERERFNRNCVKIISFQ